MSDRESARGMLGTIRNAGLLLNLLSRGAAFQPLTELAERSELSLATVHRLLRSLVSAGFVVQDPESSRYGLGPELVRLSGRYLARQPVLRSIAPYLVELRNSTKATIMVGVLARGWVAYVDRVDGEDTGGVFRESSRLRHAFDTASGRVLLAHAPDNDWDAARVAPAPSGASFEPTERSRWREAPYLITYEGRGPERFEVAVPILTATMHAALSASGGRRSFDDEAIERQIAPQLQRVAEVVERALGHG